jgi:hypothetical protein
VPNGNALIEAVVKQPEVEVEADLIRILDRRRSQPRLSDRSGQSDSKDTRVEFSRMELNRLVAKRKVYISSTYVDLKRHREALSDPSGEWDTKMFHSDSL